MPPLPQCQVLSLGRVNYRDACEFQAALASEVREAVRPNTLLFLEHPHVYTHGRLSKPEHFLATAEQLESLGAEVHETDRGGLVTYHGPGQLVAYPVVDLRGWGGPVKYVRTLEQIIIDVLADFGLSGSTQDGVTGVWADGRKIASIGVKISRGVAFHGLALNVNTDLTFFDYIVPCGLHGLEVTSISDLLGEEAEMEMVQYSMTYHLGQRMGFRMVEAQGAVNASLEQGPGVHGTGRLDPPDVRGGHRPEGPARRRERV